MDNNNNDKNKVIFLALASYFLGGFLYALAMQLNSILALISFYIVSFVLYFSGVSATYKQYKKLKYQVYLITSITGVVLLLLITLVTISYFI